MPTKANRSMRAVIIERHGGPEVLRLVDLPAPQPGSGQALVRVRACGLNHGLDGRTRQNGAGRTIGFPHVLGSEAVGEVVATGSAVQGFKAGDRVVVLPWMTCGNCIECMAGRESACAGKQILGIDVPGGYAEYLAVEEKNLIALPGSGSLEEAAAIPIGFTTAWQMLRARARVRAGETVLVLGAAGAVGIAAVQLAKHLGARVLAAASSARKLAVAGQLGADALIDYTTNPDFAGEAARLTEGRGVDVVIDHIGAATWTNSIRSLAQSGRLVMCGATTGHELQFDARQLWRRNISLLFSNSGTTADLKEVLALWAEGTIRPVLAEVLPLEEAVAAHRLLSNRDTVGKVVLAVSAGS